MTVGLLVGAIGLVLAGLLAIGYGISVKEFSVGNTLIQSGVTGVCTGALMFGFWIAVRELRNIAHRLGAGVSQPRGEVTVRPVLPPGLTREGAPGGDAASAAGSEPAAAPPPSAPPPPWQDEAASRDRPPAEPAAAAEAAAKPKR